MKTVWKIVLCSLAAVLLTGLLVWALVFDFTVPVLHLGDDFDDSGYTVMDVSGEAVISEKITALEVPSAFVPMTAMKSSCAKLHRITKQTDCATAWKTEGCVSATEREVSCLSPTSLSKYCSPPKLQTRFLLLIWMRPAQKSRWKP